LLHHAISLDEPAYISYLGTKHKGPCASIMIRGKSTTANVVLIIVGFMFMCMTNVPTRQQLTIGHVQTISVGINRDTLIVGFLQFAGA
jgi:hypothetical protein